MTDTVRSSKRGHLLLFRTTSAKVKRASSGHPAGNATKATGREKASPVTRRTSVTVGSKVAVVHWTSAAITATVVLSGGWKILEHVLRVLSNLSGWTLECPTRPIAHEPDFAWALWLQGAPLGSHVVHGDDVFVQTDYLL